MRRKISVVAVGLLAGTAMSLAPVSSSSAQPAECDAVDPVLDYVCTTVENVGPWVDYYYDKAGAAVYSVYCKLWPPC